MCNAPLKNESLESLDEAPEMAHDGIEFVVGGTTKDSESDEEACSTTPFSPNRAKQAKSSDASVRMKAQPPEVQLKNPPARPSQPHQKVSTVSKPESLASFPVVSTDLVHSSGKASTIAADVIAMSQFVTSSAKVDDDVKIVVEDEGF